MAAGSAILRPVRAPLALVVLVAVFLPAVTRAHSPAPRADDRSLAAAKQHFTAGKQAYDGGNYVVALTEFTAAETIRPSPILRYNLGLAHEKLGFAKLAVADYRAYLDAMSDASNRTEVEARIVQLQAQPDAETEAQVELPSHAPRPIPATTVAADPHHDAANAVPTLPAAAPPPSCLQPGPPARPGLSEVRIPLAPTGGDTAQPSLQAYWWKPAGRGPFPTVVYNPGGERTPVIGTDGGVGAFFQKAGYAVLFPYRRGTCRSPGTYWRDGIARLPLFRRAQATTDALVAESEDVAAALRYARAQKLVDKKRLVVAGCAFGGFEALLAGERFADLRAVIAFGGATAVWNFNAPLRARLGQAALAQKRPVLFVQAQSDQERSSSRALSDAMRAAHLPNALRLFPLRRPGTLPTLSNGNNEAHADFCQNRSDEWGPAVLEFLSGLNGDLTNNQ